MDEKFAGSCLCGTRQYKGKVEGWRNDVGLVTPVTRSALNEEGTIIHCEHVNAESQHYMDRDRNAR